MATSQRHTKRSVAANVTTPATAPGDAAAAVTLGARRVATALAEPGAGRSRGEWLTVVGDCQSLINTLTAVQDAAIAEAARRESVWCEDGTLGEAVHAPGRVTLDAADVIAPVIGATHQQAQRRVEQAVRLAARRVPVPAEARDLPDASGLGGLHEAMAAGHLDGYRAGVVAFELDVAPADVADAVVAALTDHLGEDSTSLRRRTRVLLSRISPDLVHQRAQKARANTGLRRWVAEPGVDEWHGTFPSEDAATAWAAIDRLAHDLVANSTCTNIEQARGKALTDLVTGNATIDVQIVLTVPADTQPASATDQTTVAASEPHAPPPANSQHLAPGSPEATFPASESHAPAPAVSRDDEASVVPAAAAVPGAATANTDQGTLTASELSAGYLAGGTAITQDTSATAAEGLSTPAVPSDNPAAPTTGTDDHVVEVRAASSSTLAAVVDDAAAAHPRQSPTAAESELGLAHAPTTLPPATHALLTHRPTMTGSDDDLVEVQGSRPSEPLLVRRTWLRDHLRKQPPQLRRRAKQAPSRFVPCDPLTGARLDPRDDLATVAYRPSPELAALVRARDGRCRFPGCCVAARFCDLDHVRPWPTGPTSAANLLTLCRRHHRIKQRPGWKLRLAPDGAATWTDPTGRTRTTAPLDALTPLVLAADAAPTRPTTPPTPDLVTTVTVTPTATATAWSALETHLGFTLEHHPHHDRNERHWLPPTHRRCTSTSGLRAGVARSRANAFPDTPPF